jgi:hypothetical protein
MHRRISLADTRRPRPGEIAQAAIDEMDAGSARYEAEQALLRRDRRAAAEYVLRTVHQWW